MLTIRLARVGKRNHAQYRIVLQQKTKSPKGKNIDSLGYYHPIEKKMECDLKKVELYLKDGAQPSSTMARLLMQKGVKGLEKFVEPISKKKRKGDEPAPVPAAAPAKAPEAVA